MAPLVDAVVNIDVPDLDAAVHFYCDGIGLTMRRKLFGGTVAHLDGAPLPIFLLEKESASRAAPVANQARDYNRHWTPVHFDFVVSDIGMAVRKAAAAGAVQETDVQDFAWGKLATFADPFGNGFCLVEWSTDGYDAVA